MTTSIKIKKLYILSIVFVIIGVAVLFYGLSMLNNKYDSNKVNVSPKDRLHLALENNLKVKTVKQDVYVELSKTNKYVIKSQTNFEDIKFPKTRASFDFESAGLIETIYAKGEIFSDAIDSGYAKYSNLSVDGLSGEYKLGSELTNKWFDVSLETGYMKGYFETGIGINKPLGPFLIGNFEDSLRKKVIKTAIDESIYEIKSHKNVQIDNVDTSVYELVLNTEAVNKLNTVVANDLGIDTYTENESRIYEIHVDNNQNNISSLKVSYGDESSFDRVDVKVNMYDYNIPVDIGSVDIKDLVQFKQIEDIMQSQSLALDEKYNNDKEYAFIMDTRYTLKNLNKTDLVDWSFIKIMLINPLINGRYSQ